MTTPDESGKARFFTAGAEALRENAFRLLEGGLTPDVVARRAGRSRRTFYDHFDSKSDFIRELLVTALDGPAPDPVDLEKRFNELVAELDGDFVELLHNMSRWVHEESTDPSAAPVRLIALALGHDEADIRAALVARTENRDAPIRAFASRSLNAWGMSLRPPWTPQRLAIVVRALGDGLYLRNRLGERDANEELLTLTVLSLAPSLMQPGECIPDTIDDIIHSHAADASRVWRETNRPELVANSRATVLEALETQLDRHGYNHADLGEVAAASGMSTTTILRAYGDIDTLIKMAVEDHLPFLENEVEVELQADDRPLAVAERHVRRLVDIVDRNRVLFRSLLAMTFGANDQSRKVELVDRLDDPLKRCLGAHGSDPDIDITARAITHAIVASTISGDGKERAEALAHHILRRATRSSSTPTSQGAEP